MRTHTHTAAFCGCEFMGWSNDKNSSQRVALWSPLLSLATSGFTVNNWAAIEGRKRNAEGEYERKTDKFIYLGTMGDVTKRLKFLLFFLRLLFVTMHICDSFCSSISVFVWWCLCGQCCFVSVLPQSHLSVAVWSALGLLPWIFSSVDTFWVSVCTAHLYQCSTIVAILI